jgi:hypothetical protein
MVGLWIIGSALEGYLTGIGRLPFWSRPLLFFAGIFLGYPVGWLTDIIGFVIIVFLLSIVIMSNRYSQSHS